VSRQLTAVALVVLIAATAGFGVREDCLMKLVGQFVSLTLTILWDRQPAESLQPCHPLRPRIRVSGAFDLLERLLGDLRGDATGERQADHVHQIVVWVLLGHQEVQRAGRVESYGDHCA
jgi:hypothetical protein